MNKNDKLDDHHCSVIEKKRLEQDMADCDTTHNSEDARKSCQAKAKQASSKREQACKYS